MKYESKIQNYLVIAKIFILGHGGKWFATMKICGNLPLTQNRGLPQTALSIGRLSDT
jgi:hypothetical protein